MIRCRRRETRSEARAASQRAYKAKRAARLKADPPKPLSHERLLAIIRYDPATGKFLWLVGSGKRTDLTGKPAGGPTSDGYVRIAVDDKRYRAHRLAWFYMTGKWPKDEIDHRNGVRTDNRWGNLREATSSLNKQNRRDASRHNKSGLLGVSRVISGGNYRARIDDDHLGVFPTAEAAHAAYVEEKRRRHEGGTL